MRTANHTQTPWTYKHDGSLWRGSKLVTDLSGSKEDHAYIFRAVNAHEALLDIVRQLDATADSQIQEHVQRRRIEIRAALKLAEGGGS